MKILRRTLTGLGLVLLAVLAILATSVASRDAHAAVTSRDVGRAAPTSTCDICATYFSDVTQSCNPDGSTHWTAIITNNGDCTVTTGWNANLLVQENYGDYNTVLTVHGGPQDFPPGDTTIGGDLNYPIPPDATGQEVIVVFDTSGGSCGFREGKSGQGPPCFPTTGTPALTNTPTNTRTRTRTRTPAPTHTDTETAVPPSETPIPPSDTPVPPSDTPTNTPTNTHINTPTRTVTVVPSTRTRTATPVPSTGTPTNTPTPQETCPAGTPTRIATPAFTPRPGCSDTPPDGVLVAAITDHGTTTEANFRNTSTTCSYRIGLATYKKFDENVDNQELFDYRLAIIPPNSTLTLVVNNPVCAYQGDAFYGDLITSFAGGVRYGMRLLDDNFGHNGNYCTLHCIAPSTPTRTATPGGCGGGNPCAGIYSPGYWAHNHPQHTDAQFQSFLDQTDFAPITIQQAQCYLNPSCVHEQTRRAILAGEINAAASSDLAQGVYHLPGSSVDGFTVSQILSMAYQLWSTGQTLPSDLANAVGYVSGGALGDGSNGEGQPAGSCRVINTSCTTPTNTRTRTNTPAPGSTNTRTRTNTPVPGSTNTPTRTPTPGHCGDNPCAGIYSPGYWAHNHPQHTDAQFQSFLDQTDFAPITIQQAQCYLNPSCVHEQTRRAILAGEINAAGSSTLADSVYHLQGSSIDGQTPRQFLATAYHLWSTGQSLPSDLADAVGYISGGALGNGGSGEGKPPANCRLQNICIGRTP